MHLLHFQAVTSPALGSSPFPSSQYVSKDETIVLASPDSPLAVLKYSLNYKASYRSSTYAPFKVHAFILKSFACMQAVLTCLFLQQCVVIILHFILYTVEFMSQEKSLTVVCKCTM